MGYTVLGLVESSLSKSFISLYSEASQDLCTELKGDKEIMINNRKLYTQRMSMHSNDWVKDNILSLLLCQAHFIFLQKILSSQY